MISNERGGTKYPQTEGTGENTPFTKQSRKKERDNGHDSILSVKHSASDVLYWGGGGLTVFLMLHSLVIRLKRAGSIDRIQGNK